MTLLFFFRGGGSASGIGDHVLVSGQLRRTMSLIGALRRLLAVHGKANRSVTVESTR